MTLRNACPTVHEPMPAGDGLLLRVKPRCGLLMANVARLIAERAETDGNGAIQLTSRGNLQLRGFNEASATAFAQAMVHTGIACADPAAERRRNLIVSPLADRRAMRVASALESAIIADSGLAALPAKFCFLLDTAGISAAADIMLRQQDDGWSVMLDGAPLAVDTNDPVGDAIALAHRFLQEAGGARHMRDVSAPALFRNAGLQPRHSTPPQPKREQPGPWQDGFAFGLPFGTCDVQILSALADIAERRSAGRIWLTPWHTAIIQKATAADAENLPLITNPDDPRTRVTACIGQPRCGKSSVDTRGVADGLAAEALPVHVHVSGCPKHCGQPQWADLVLTGENGKFELRRTDTNTVLPL